MYCSMFICIPRARFMSIVQVFFSVFSVSLWQNYRATFWSGMYTTSFCVDFMVSCVRRYFLRRGGKKDWIGKALASCGCSLRPALSELRAVHHCVDSGAGEDKMSLTKRLRCFVVGCNNEYSSHH